ncbi:MAG: 1,4-dihydroxy-2-naphthoyl-CoA hydrolase [Candidatus Heimdallarchaeota archaeon LC_3]|nr:MAG: 1,4-dihydroxy-2-naphthoyl-CoA hydrolase [Candidatus Heimdallarchaeota archaeon LC_3]
MSFNPLDTNYKFKVRNSFQRQIFMSYLDAELVKVEPGYCEIHLDYREELTQQHGYFHGGVIGTLADNVGGYSAFTLTPKDSTVLSIEYKINLLNSGEGEKLIARGQVIKSGKNLTVCQADVFVVKNNLEKLCATALVTIITLHGKPDK